MELYFIRHTSVDVPAGTCYGRSDVPLKASFEQEAAQVRERLTGIKFDKVFSSPLSRATRLAVYCGFPTPILDDRVREVDYGEWEMQRFDHIDERLLKAWYDDWRYVRPPQGESFWDEYQRVAAFIDEIRQHDWKRVAVFCHGGVLLCAAIYAGLFPFDGTFTRQFDYGEVFSFSTDDITSNN